MRPDDPELFARIAPLGLGGEVPERYVPLLLEQGGFQKSQPTLPRSRPLPKTTKLAIIGGGMAGMTAAIAAADAGVDYEIFDRLDEVGGTWRLTTYPGIAVDTPSTYYSLSTDVHSDWSNYYPVGPEYQRYLQAVADKHGIREHTRFNTEVEALWWDEDRQEWQVHSRAADGSRDVSYATAVVTAAGYLNRPAYPDLEGRESFEGISIHSAEWDPDLDLSGKRVAIIGVGCTAVQIVDSIADEVAHLTVFQRQPHWVAPRRRLSDDVPEFQRYLGRHVPYFANWVRLKSYWGTADNNFGVVKVDPDWAASHVSISPANDVLLQLCLSYIDKSFGAGSELAKKMTPDFAPFGKRIVRDPGGYYAALAKPHVDVESAPARVTRKGIVTQDGRGSNWTPSSTRPDITWTSCPTSTFGAAAARACRTSGPVSRNPIAEEWFRASRICSSHRTRTGVPVMGPGTTSVSRLPCTTSWSACNCWRTRTPDRWNRPARPTTTTLRASTPRWRRRCGSTRRRRIPTIGSPPAGW